jgi:hypothetical protein
MQIFGTQQRLYQRGMRAPLLCETTDAETFGRFVACSKAWSLE